MQKDVGMARYVEAARAHYEANPEAEHALHSAHLDSLGISGAAKQHIIKERMAAVAAHLASNESVRAGISKLDDKSQIAALSKIHEQEQEGPSDDDENAETDKYLASRGQTASRR